MSRHRKVSRRGRVAEPQANRPADVPPWVEPGYEWIDPAFDLALCVLAEVRGLPKTCGQRACRAAGKCAAAAGTGPVRACAADFGGEDVEPVLRAMFRFAIVVETRAREKGFVMVPAFLLAEGDGGA